MSTCEILGIPIEVGQSGELYSKIRSFVGRGGVICTPNPVILSNSLKNTALRRALLCADLCIPDGSGLLPFLKKRYKDAAVYPGVELGRRLVGDFKGLSIGIVGGGEGIAQAAFDALSKQSCGLKAAFLLNGYETPLSLLLSVLLKTKPDLVFVCLGSPKQEILMHSLHLFSPKTLFLGLGGSLDVYAGKVRRAPLVFRKLHLEWLYRMMREPRRLSQLSILFRFPFRCYLYREENNNVTKKSPLHDEN